MKEKVLALLQECFPDKDFTTGESLVSSGVMDSLMITQIIAELTMEFGITIPYEDIVQENFDSVAAIAAMVERLQK